MNSTIALLFNSQNTKEKSNVVKEMKIVSINYFL